MTLMQEIATKQSISSMSSYYTSAEVDDIESSLMDAVSGKADQSTTYTKAEVDIAIAAGISDGMGLGSNARAALITRGLGEIARFGEALGADPQTFMGLSGMGDLVLTCTDDQSRNRRFGIALTRLGAVENAKNEVGELVEGASTALAVNDMAVRLEIDIPIISQVAAILNGDSTPEDAVRELLTRELVSEHD